MRSINNKSDHVALVIGTIASPENSNKTINAVGTSDELLKNIMVVARQNEIRYLTLYCIDDIEPKTSSVTTCELNILLYLLLIEADWFQNNKVIIRADGDCKSNAIDDPSSLQVFVIPSSNAGNEHPANNRTSVISTAPATGNRDDLQASLIAKNISSYGLPDPDQIIFSAGSIPFEKGFAAHPAHTEFVFMDKHWKNWSPQEIDQMLNFSTGHTRQTDQPFEDKDSHAKVA